MRSSRRSNSEIVAMIRAGGTERNMVLTELINEERGGNRLKAYFTRRGLQHADFEDVYFQALEELVVAIQAGRFKEEGDIRGYLFGMCKNIWLNWMKKNTRTSRGEHIEEHYERENDNSAVDTLIAEEEWEKAWARFKTLSDLCRKILTLAFFEKKTNEEIAEMVDYKDERVVRVKKSKCLKALWELSTEE